VVVGTVVVGTVVVGTVVVVAVVVDVLSGRVLVVGRSVGLEASVDDSRHDVITVAMSIAIRALLA
jgi:hypothetical protein